LNRKCRKAYDPKTVEDKWYKYWLEKDYFKPVDQPEKEAFYHYYAAAERDRGLHMGHA